MATLNATALTLADWAKRLDPNGKVDAIIEILNQTNEILDDWLFVEGNKATGHITTVRSGLPDVAWRKLNYGVQPSKSRTVKIEDSCGFLEAYSVVDKRLADLNGNTAEFRLSEDKAFLEAMSQEAAQTLFYGDTDVHPERFLGLAPRYDSLSAENKDNIIDAGGNSTDNTSIWLVVWGNDTVHGIFPKGSRAGIRHEDLGEDTVRDANGGEYQAYRTHYAWDLGLTVRDWRYVVRIANIKVSDLTTVSNTKNLISWMIQASERIPSLGKGRAAWYVNRTIREKLRLGILEKVASNLTWETVSGKRVMMFDDVPVRRCDAIINNEAQVT